MYYFQKQRDFTLAWKLYEAHWMQVSFIIPFPFFNFDTWSIHNDLMVDIYKVMQSMLRKCNGLGF